MNFVFSVIETGRETIVLFPGALGGGWVELHKSSRGEESPRTAVKVVLYGDIRRAYDGSWGRVAFKRQFGPSPDMPLNAEYTEIAVPVGGQLVPGWKIRQSPRKGAPSFFRN